MISPRTGYLTCDLRYKIFATLEGSRLMILLEHKVGFIEFNELF